MSSTFDAGNEGWQVVGMPDSGPYHATTSGPIPATYEPSQGVPAGSISLIDIDGNTTFFSAPGTYLGNQLSTYGTSISFDLMILYNNGWVSADVALTDGVNSLAIDAGPEPVIGPWTHYSVNLNDLAGWKVGNINGALATEADIKNVLSDLQGLYIRGEYAWGDDYSYLDNVRMGQVPEGGSSLALLGGAFALLGAASRKFRK